MTGDNREKRWDVGDEVARNLTPFLRGRIVRPGDDDYEEARETHQANVQRHPQLIVQAESTADVVAVVNFARERNLPLAIRSGGHNVYSTSDDVVLDLSHMKAISIDAEQQTARVEPGATWGEVSAATQAHGLAVPAGDTASVGVGGLAVGGGIGWLVRKHGMTIDNLISAQVVTADGRVLTASEDENRDLFWAIRGGGGNFGVVTAFEFRAHPVGMILGGAIVYDAEDGEQVLRGYADYAAGAPEELTTIVFIMHAPPAPFIPADKVGKLVILIGLCYAGDLEEGQRVVDGLRHLGTLIADATAPMPYSAIFMLTKEGEAKGNSADIRSTFMPRLTDGAIETVLNHARSMSSPFSIVQLRILGGAMSRVPGDATAFTHRQAGAMVTGLSIWMDPGESEHHYAWTAGFLRDVVPYSDGVYVNFLGLESEDRVREAYGPITYRRLVSLKDKYDPSNFFSLNHNIRPSEQQAQGDKGQAA